MEFVCDSEKTGCSEQSFMPGAEEKIKKDETRY
jgi:hypothetical protein